MNTTTYLLEELDDGTKEYLLAVRDNAGAKMPGVYVPGEKLPETGCVIAVGVTLAIVTLMFTLTTWLGVIYEDTARVALLQTAGLLVAGWIAAAPIRIKLKAQGMEVAGHWVYADPLNVYEADGEKVHITPTTDLKGASFDHSEGKEGEYKHTTLTLRPKRKKDDPRTVVVHHQEKAERVAEYIEYLAWARGPEGEARKDLPPEDLDALARYYVKHGDEPVDAEGNPDPAAGLGAKNWKDDIPRDPESVRKVPPKLVPYAVLLVAAVCIFFMMQTVNTSLRDSAIFAAVTTDPVEPRYLRQYLSDPRNTAGREAVTTRLAGFYQPAIARLRGAGPGSPLRAGMAEVLESAKSAEQPIVSVRVTEADAPAGADGKDARVGKVRDKLAVGVGNALTALSPQIVIPAGMTIDPPPAPVGEQLLAFVEAPADAANAHFEVRYRFVPEADGRFKVAGRVEVRAAIDAAPAGVDEVETQQAYTPAELAAGVEEFANLLVQKLTQ